MQITKEQINILNSLTCERLSESALAKQCALSIVSQRGAQLVRYLQQYGSNEDFNGVTAYYVVRNNDNLALAFFSLKSGLIFEPSTIDSVENDVEFNKHIIEILEKGENKNNPDSIALFHAAKELALKHNCPLEKMVRNMILQAQIKSNKAINHKHQYHDDEKTEANKPIFRVDKTYPGVELAHFCTNDVAKSYWRTLSMNHPMGEVIFWWFIMPIIEKVRTIIGCQFAYLFAADASEDRTLINYYNISLKFISKQGLGTSKPRYDYCCEFLLQDINQLLSYRKDYFQHFNIDEDVEIV